MIEKSYLPQRQLHDKQMQLPFSVFMIFVLDNRDFKSIF